MLWQLVHQHSWLRPPRRYTMPAPGKHIRLSSGGCEPTNFSNGFFHGISQRRGHFYLGGVNKFLGHLGLGGGFRRTGSPGGPLLSSLFLPPPHRLFDPLSRWHFRVDSARDRPPAGIRDQISREVNCVQSGSMGGKDYRQIKVLRPLSACSLPPPWL